MLRLNPALLKAHPEAAEHVRREKATRRQFVAALQSGDIDQLHDCIREGEQHYGFWPWMWRRIAKADTLPPRLRAYLRALLRHSGDHIRCETGNDLLIATALRRVLPPYRGQGRLLYRGEGLVNRARRTYGLSWTSSRAVADGFAEYVAKMGVEAVTLAAHAPPEAIIFRVPREIDTYAEREYFVDRRMLDNITVVRRFAARMEHDAARDRSC